MNRPIFKNNKSGFKGVHLNVWGKYIAQIQVRKRKIKLGQFLTPEEAHTAYVVAAKKHFGEFASLT